MSWVAKMAGTTADRAAERGSASTALHEQHLPLVFAYVSRRIRPREDAEDITAEVFASALEASWRQPAALAPELWLLGIARRKVADVLRRRYRRREVPAAELATDEIESIPGIGPTPLACALVAEGTKRIREAVFDLSPDQREAILLRYADGLTVAEVAAVLGRSPAAANSLLERARAALRRRTEGYFRDSTESKP